VTPLRGAQVSWYSLGMTTNTTARTFPAYDLKGGDHVEGREVFDVIDTFGHKVAILFTDGTRLVVSSWNAVIEVTN
jgi:hypothetical protein